MNGDLLNQLVDELGTILSTFRSLKTFSLQTSSLLKEIPRTIIQLKKEYPKPNQAELDLLIDLETSIKRFETNLPNYSRNLVQARTGFVDEVLSPLWIGLNSICTENPKYSNWLTKLKGYDSLKRMVGL